jgi:phage tail-like protein
MVLKHFKEEETMMTYRHLQVLAVALLAAMAYPAESPAADDPGSAEELFGNYDLRLEIDGATIGGFKHVSGLSAETEVVEFREGGENTVVHKLPGRLKYANIVLRRGFVGDDFLHDWIQETLHPEGVIVRRDGALILSDNSGNEVVHFNFYAGWPCQWRLIVPQSELNKVTSEEVVLCIEWFEEA